MNPTLHTLSPEAMAALTLSLTELEAAAAATGRRCRIDIGADVEVVKGEVAPLLTIAAFDGCRPPVAALVSVDPDQDGTTYAYTAAGHMMTYPDAD